ncbi:MAG: hypothetical protein PHQ27_11275 [Victivallales bacterium]|nr:hypothetical protein [Victivallales bacterium]
MEMVFRIMLYAGMIIAWIVVFVLAVFYLLMPIYVYLLHIRLKRMEDFMQHFGRNLDNRLREANDHLKSIAAGADNGGNNK